MVKRAMDYIRDLIKELSPYILLGMLITYGIAIYKFSDNIKTPPVDMPKIEESTNDINGIKKIDKSKKMNLEDYYQQL